ncbi:zinc finger CCHC domain-containing protein 24-like [Antedon mediterranea]|uniref:zinc finger CCHC domain-containing protein 24-like n=1 Tax=Antedon mediterranea TaxID=105859 RepID=UPI003AF7089B
MPPKTRSKTRQSETQPEAKTPYQGKKRAFGEFKCTSCRKTWSSANSWANMGQQCKKCKINVYPHKQNPLKPTEGEYNREHHNNNLCEMCTKLRYSCKEYNP